MIPQQRRLERDPEPLLELTDEVDRFERSEPVARERLAAIHAPGRNLRRFCNFADEASCFRMAVWRI